LASENGHLKVVDLLLKDPRGRAEPCGSKAVDPSVDDQYAIKWASRLGYIEIVGLLLKDSRVDPSAEDQYAIKWAYKREHKKIMEMLLQDSRVAKLYSSPST
jgi:Ankyrin repeats (3 copies)